MNYKENYKKVKETNRHNKKMKIMEQILFMKDKMPLIPL